MLFRAVALAALATTTLAHQLNDRHLHFHEARGLNVLEKRQDQQFQPTTTTATGDTCADAFGAGYETCREATDSTNRLCYNPSIGQTCCSNQYACPSGSFCLNSGNCCPNGLDPNTCAAMISSSSSAAQASSSAVKAVSSSKASTTNSTSIVTKTATSSVTLPVLSTAPFHVSTNATKVVASTGKPSAATVPSSQFTGAASRFELSVAGLLGVAGLVAGLL